MKFFVKTFGCIQNTADSERIRFFYLSKKFEEVKKWKEADLIIINSCIVRESAENRVYGLINEINKEDKRLSIIGHKKRKIIVTGCLAGLINKDKNKAKLKQFKRNFPTVSKFMPIEKISMDIKPLRKDKDVALIPISFGCSNFCSYCIVPFARGKERSRKMEDILKEVDEVVKSGFKKVMLIGQNVNSYLDTSSPLFGAPFNERGNTSYIVHMGKKRFRSLFPKLLKEVAKKDLEKVSFVSSNPWDFSDELIETIAEYPNIDRLIHLPFQSGDDKILKKMNRGYTSNEYLDLIKKIKTKIPEVRFSTDIIIGFPGEDEKAFQNTIKLCKKVKFEIAYLNKYSPRKGTISAKIYKNDIPMKEKKRRWEILNKIINNI